MKKKVLFINNSLGGGGAERILIDILRSINYEMFNVDLVLISGTGVYLKSIPPQVNYLGSVYDQETDIYDFRSVKDRFDEMKESMEIRRLVKGNYDTIISYLEGYAARYHHYILDKASNNVSWVHVDLLMNHWSRLCYVSSQQEAAVYAKMDKVVFVSKDILDAFRMLFHYNKENLMVINNPIDKQRIMRSAEEYNVEKEVFSFIAVGRFFRQKRYDRMMHAVKILHDRGCDFCLDILGAGELEPEIKELTCRFGIEQVVRFHGFVRNPYPHIKKADVMLLSSDAEGFPTVICEAMTLGVPVIGTNVSGTRDLIGDSEYGMLTDLTPESFADAMYQLYMNAEKRSHYAAKSLERAKSFSFEKEMQRIFSIL